MDGRCKDCTLEERLKKLQVLRFIMPAHKNERNEVGCASYANEPHVNQKISRSGRAGETR